MSGAALALALALLVVPPSPRHRVHVRNRDAAPPQRRSTARAWAQLLACAAALALVLGVLTSPGVVAAVVLICVTVGLRRRRRHRQLRCAAEATTMQGALDILVGELRVGAHPAAAFGTAAKEVDGVVAESLRTVAARARMGADVAEGMYIVAQRSSLPAHWERLALCWRLAQSHGLAIATLLQTAQRDLVERERFSARVNAGMAGARATAGVLAVLPAVGLALGQLIGANPLGFLLSGGVGEWLLVIGVAFACAGLLWSDQITSRVLR
jgi:tight adherence protein B